MRRDWIPGNYLAAFKAIQLCKSISIQLETPYISILLDTLRIAGLRQRHKSLLETPAYKHLYMSRATFGISYRCLYL